jgi:hypothetical protein
LVRVYISLYFLHYLSAVALRLQTLSVAIYALIRNLSNLSHFFQFFLQLCQDRFRLSFLHLYKH